MSFLPGLLTAASQLLPGVVSTVGNVIGRLTKGDFSGALGEVGKALTGGGGEKAAEVVKTVGKDLAEAEKIKEDERKLDRELRDRERSLQLNEMQYELELRRRGMHRNRANDMMPIWRGREQDYNEARSGYMYEGPKNTPQDQTESGKAIHNYSAPKLPPIPKNKRRRRRV